MPQIAGRNALMEQLVADGVRYVFGNPGTTEQAFQDALQDYPQIEYILALHESVAVGIADGYARASGKPSFAQLHIDFGLGNAMGMLCNSERTRTPMVVYAGQQPQRGGTQEPILARELVAAEPLIDEVAAEFDGEDPLKPITREMLTRTRSELEELLEQLRERLGPLELGEPSDEEMDVLRKAVDLPANR